MLRIPAKQELRRWSADPSLARPHAAAGMQLGFTPREHRIERSPSHIFAATYKRIRRDEFFQLGSQRKCSIKLPLETQLAIPPFEEMRAGAASTDQPSNFTLAQRLLQAANPGRLTNAKDASHRRLLRVVYLHISGSNLTLKQAREFEIWNEMESASKAVALNRAQCSIYRNRDRLQRSITVRLDDPCARSIRSVSRCCAIARTLTQFAGKAKKLHAKIHYARGRCLFEDAEDLRTFSGQRCSNGEQQWTTARKHNALAFGGQSALHHRLKPANAHHALQGPSRKRQKTFTRPCGQDEPAILYVLESRESLDSQNIQGWMRHHAGFSAQVDRGGLEKTL